MIILYILCVVEGFIINYRWLTTNFNSRLFCSNMHFNENSQRKQAKTEMGEDRWVVIYPKAHKGEKYIAGKIKEEATYSMFNTRIQ